MINVNAKFTVILSTLLLQTLCSTELELELIGARNIAISGENEPQPTIFVGETFNLKSIIKNADRDTGEVKINGIEKLRLLGKSSHSNITMLINGKFTSEKSQIYDVSAEREGVYEVGPAEVNQNNRTIKSNTIKFRVVRRPANYKESDGEEKDNENAVECQLISDKKTAFVGEQLIITLRIKCLGKIHNLGLVNQITFPGFQVKSESKPEQMEETKNNKTYQVIENKFYLTALDPGEHKINPAQIIYHVAKRQKKRPMGMFDDSFFGFGGLFDQARLIQKNAYSNDLAIKILTLPNTNENYDGIGVFTSYKSCVDKKSALLNEAIKFTLELEGEGNFEQISTPKLTLDQFIKSYESKSEFVEKVDVSPFAGKKIFEYVIQINKTGQIVIEAQKFKYLDTVTKSVKSLETKPIILQILQPEGEAVENLQAPTKGMEIKQQEQTGQNQDQGVVTDELDKINKAEISFIEQEGEVLQASDKTLPWWLMFILMILPIIFFTRSSRNVLTKLWSSRILTNATRRSSMNKIINEFHKIKNSNKPEQLYSFFLNMLSVKFNMPTQDLSYDQILEKLRDAGVEDSKISDFMDFLNECASLHFITKKNITAATINESLFKRSEYWIIMLAK